MREYPGSHNVKRPRGSTVLRVLLASIVLASVGLVIQMGTPLGGSPVFATAVTDCTSTLPTLDDGKYIIDTPGKLRHVAENVSTTSATFANKSLLQTADLDLTNCGDWPGIGLYYLYDDAIGAIDNNYGGEYGLAFSGIYDGNGKSISNLKISRSISDTGVLYYGVGLFGWIDGAEIRNVKLTNSTVSAELQGGGLIGLAQGSTVSGSSFSGEISGNSDIGGLIGKAVNTTVSVSAFNGSVAAHNSYKVGGLIGWSQDSTVEGSSAAGSVTTNSSYQGGLIGLAQHTVITNSFASTIVIGQSQTGGLVGQAENSTVTKSFAAGSVTGSGSGSNEFGGLIGAATYTSVSDSYATGATTADLNDVGGLIGYSADLTLTNSFATGRVTTTGGFGGGLIGRADQASLPSTVTASFWDVTATGQSGTSLAGGSGKTTAQMKSFSPFRGAGWKITANDTPRVWGLCDNGSSYPFLMWQTTLGVGAPGSVACTVGTGDLGLAGEGTEASPYEISTYADLLLLSGELSIWNKHFVQTAHITVTDSTMTPIGSNALKFIGVYDGQGFEIRNLVINTPSLNRVGLFGSTDNAVIRNVRIINAALTGGYAVGGLIGRADNTVVENSSTAGTVTGQGEAGGLIGDSRNGSVSGSFSSSSVTLSGWNGGGLVGYAEYLSVTNSYANGPISGGNSVGGLIGYDGDGSVSSSYAVGAVTGNDDLGGLIGYSSETTVTSSFWDLDTSGQSSSSGGTGRKTAVMQSFATFNELWSIANGYDVSKTWGICAAEGLNGYPFLTWQYSEAPCEASDDDSVDDSQENSTDENGTGGEGESSSFTPSPTLPGDRQSDSAATPLLVDGALPQMALGEVMVYEDGVPVTVQIFVDDDTELVIEASTFELRLSGECETGCTVEETDAGQLVLTLEQDGAARTDGVGFEPGSKVDVWLFSEPRYLGQLTVSADGTFSGTLPLGDIEVGAHTLQVNGLSAQGVQRSANIGVVVNALEIPTVGTLPTTGARSDLAPWLILLISIGGILLLVSRRPRFNQNCLR
jgi:hypothetical protein